MSNSQFIVLGDLNLEYKTFGEGKKIVFCFHGFSREAEDFLVFSQALVKEYTFVGVNFFLHGKSNFNLENRIGNKPISKFEWIKVIEKLLAAFKLKKAIFMGYSMGGRLCLNLAEAKPELVEKLILIAPDGLKMNPWYKFSSRTYLGRGLFKLAAEKPQTLFPLAKGLVNIGLLPKKAIKLATDNFNSEEQRNLVYNTWIASRKLIPNLTVVKENIVKHKMPYHLIFGAFDKFIPPHLAPILQEGTEQFGQIHVLNSGHLLLTNSTVAYAIENQIL
ncbi:MAG: alpha/beta hydrolase [Luteibaculaceae bacterium]